jgi:hypothetical protein
MPEKRKGIWKMHDALIGPLIRQHIW